MRKSIHLTAISIGWLVAAGQGELVVTYDGTLEESHDYGKTWSKVKDAVDGTPYIVDRTIPARWFRATTKTNK